MDSENLKHRLAAILAADVAGYSRLMSNGEPATVAALDHARGIFQASIEANQGRVIDMAGDSVLAVFETATGAVTSALDIQQSLNDTEPNVPESERMLFRIGIHLGDVLEKSDGSIYGDGVNVAARVESLAQPGGVAVSDMVYGAVRDKVSVPFDDAGEHDVKNIARPIRVYHARLDGAVDSPIPVKSGSGRSKRPWAIGAALAVLVGLGAVTWWQTGQDNVEPADPANMAYALPKTPSIAVLPFDNMSKDKTQEYFSDGMTEDITTDLSKVSGLFVISRNSAFSYKGKPVKIRQIAEELGVRYVLEGSVRRSENQVRINAQLIDAITGGHIWAERFDGSVTDVFALQDRITAAIVQRLQVVLLKGEQAALANNNTTIPEAHEAYLIGVAHMRTRTFDALSKAKTSLETAVELDPGYAKAWGELAILYDLASRRRLLTRLGFDEDSGSVLLDKALARPTVQAYRAQLHWLDWAGRTDELPAILDRMDKLEPNYWPTRYWRGHVASLAGDTELAMTHFQSALRLDPANPRIAWRIGRVHIQAGRYEKAVNLLEKAAAQDPDSNTMLGDLVAAYALSGQMTRARKAAKRLIEKRKADGYITTITRNFARLPRTNPELVKRVHDGLNLAGIPRKATESDLDLSPEQRVTDKRLRDTIVNFRRIGKTARGKWMADHFVDGTGAFYWLGVELSRFDWQITENRLYVNFHPPSKQKPYSCDTYVDPNGTRNSFDKYLSVCTHNVVPFSVFPIPADAK